MRSLPTHLRIGHHLYCVAVEDGLGLNPDANGNPTARPCWGLCQDGLELITLDGDILDRPMQLAETLVHESLHAISKHQALDLSEEQVRRIGHGITSLLVDNAALRAIVEDAAAHLRETAPDA